VLDKTLADYPKQPPDRKRYPACNLTHVARFREALKSAGVTDAESSDTECEQWQRIKDKLMEQGLLRIEGDFCWRAA
jgi:hypothetical protein